MELNSIIYNLKSTEPPPGHMRFPFSKIEILDSRFDTSKLGFTYDLNIKRFNYKDFKKIKLNGGIADRIQFFYNDHYHACMDKSDDRLLIVLKKLWIDNIPGSWASNREYDQEHPSYQDIYIKFEYYMHRGNEYYPLLRVDTLYQLTDENVKITGTELKRIELSFFSNMLQSVIQKHDFDNLFAKAPAKKKLSMDEIRAFNEKRFLLPILTAEKYNEGVFKNSMEFINNNPSVKKFRVNKRGKLTTIGNEKAMSSIYWAFADSNGLHLNSAKKREIFRTGNAFEFFSEEAMYVPRTVAGLFLDSFLFITSPGLLNRTSSSSSQTSIKIITIPRQLDMENGQSH